MPRLKVLQFVDYKSRKSPLQRKIRCELKNLPMHQYKAKLFSNRFRISILDLLGTKFVLTAQVFLPDYFVVEHTFPQDNRHLQRFANLQAPHLRWS